MRGVLEQISGVSGSDVQPGRADIKVSYDPGRTDVERVLAGLQAAGQPARTK